jgi:hypothetical protein
MWMQVAAIAAEAVVASLEGPAGVLVPVAHHQQQKQKSESLTTMQFKFCTKFRHNKLNTPGACCAKYK